jgi:hypothetical protein
LATELFDLRAFLTLAKSDLAADEQSKVRQSASGQVKTPVRERPLMELSNT